MIFWKGKKCWELSTHMPDMSFVFDRRMNDLFVTVYGDKTNRTRIPIKKWVDAPCANVLLTVGCSASTGCSSWWAACSAPCSRAWPATSWTRSSTAASSSTTRYTTWTPTGWLACSHGYNTHTLIIHLCLEYLHSHSGLYQKLHRFEAHRRCS